VIDKPNTVIDSTHIIGCVDVEADNVTIQNSWITSTDWFAIIYGDKNPSVTGLKVLHTTMDIDKPKCPNGVNCNYGLNPNGNGTYEVGWSNISGFKDGLDISTGYIHDNYIWGLLQFDGAHTQDIYVWPGGTGVRIVHNTLISDIVDSTASIYVTDNQGHQQNVTIENNWLAGGSYALYAGDSTATQIVVTNNKFSTEVTPNSGYYGAVTDIYHNTDNVFSGNVWANGPNAGQAIPEP
jgi:hypothetical protein